MEHTENQRPNDLEHNLHQLAEQVKHVRTQSQYKKTDSDIEDVLEQIYTTIDENDPESDRLDNLYTKHVLPVFLALRGGLGLPVSNPLTAVKKEKQFIGNANNIKKNVR